MKHRGSSKIKYEHNMIPGLRKLLEGIEDWEEIRTIIPAEIRPKSGHHQLHIVVQYETMQGLKCLAKGATAVQEVFFVSTHKEALKQKLLALTTA